MEIIHKDKKITEPLALTMGSFDGVHKGHLGLIKQLKDLATPSNYKTAILTFVPHPKLYFDKSGKFKLLNTLEEKIEQLEKTGVDYLILQEFNQDFGSQEPEDFIKKLKDNYNLKLLLMGYDHHFGKDKKGDYKHVKSLEDSLDFETLLIKPVLIDGVPISSSRIRSLVQNGEVEKANELLGYPFLIQGKVVSGNRFGNQLGFPTANINLNSDHKILPKQGVYIVKSPIDGNEYYGMMNLGVRPTINGTKQIMEVHFFDFDKDIYGKDLKIEFLKPLRSEKKFPSLEALTQQLKKDRELSLKWLKQKNLKK